MRRPYAAPEMTTVNVETATREDLAEYLLAHRLGTIPGEDIEEMRDTVRLHMEGRS